MAITQLEQFDRQIKGLNKKLLKVQSDIKSEQINISKNINVLQAQSNILVLQKEITFLNSNLKAVQNQRKVHLLAKTTPLPATNPSPVTPVPKTIVAPPAKPAAVVSKPIAKVAPQYPKPTPTVAPKKESLPRTKQPGAPPPQPSKPTPKVVAKPSPPAASSKPLVVTSNNNKNNTTNRNKSTTTVVKKVINVDCINKYFDDIVDILLNCIPRKIPLLHHEFYLNNKLSRTNDEYYNHNVPMMFEEMKSQVVSEMQELGIETNAEGEFMFDIAKLKDKLIPLTVTRVEEDYAGDFTDISFNIKYKPEHQIFVNDYVLLSITVNNTTYYSFGLICGVSNQRQTQKTKLLKSIVRIADSVDHPHSKEFMDFVFNEMNKPRSLLNNYLFLTKVSNLVTFQREITAITWLKQTTSIQKSGNPIIDTILTPCMLDYTKAHQDKHVIPEPVIKNMHSCLNPSQNDAIMNCMNKSGITLIAGPPGTGKTNTIMALLAIFHYIFGANTKIMVCAPSNTAVDAVGLRILDKGLPLGYSGPFKAVRAGRIEAIHKGVRSIALSDYSLGFGDKNRMVRSASIILCTNSGSKAKILNAFKPDIVIIDESTQSVESSTLVPISKGAPKLILIGDTKQLPPTVFSDRCSRFEYNISLFERLSKLLPTHMLRTQYRMHPSISKFPSNKFYSGSLKDGENVLKYKQRFYNDKLFGPIRFYDIVDSKEEKSTGKSIKNVSEIRMVFLLLKEMAQKYPEIKPMDIGIITPYKLQRSELQTAKLVFNEKMNVDINTVDGFQGAEKDIIIFSCVRESKIGFLSDKRRINVGITRARYANFIVGHSSLLEKDPTWKLYLQMLRKNGCFSQINSNGIQSREEQVVKHDLLHPEDLIDPSTQDPWREIKDYLDERDDRLHQEVDDDDQLNEELLNSIEEEEDQESFLEGRINNINNQTEDKGKKETSILSYLFSGLSLSNNNNIVQNRLVKKDYLLKNLSILVSELDKPYTGDCRDKSSLALHRNEMKENEKKILKFNNEWSRHLRDKEQTIPLPSGLNSGVSKKLDSLLNTFVCNLEKETNENKELKKQSIKRLNDFIKEKYPKFQLGLYGSYKSGIQLKSSDLDVSLITPTSLAKEVESPTKASQMMKDVALDLHRSGKFKLERVICNARVPIIKFSDITTGINFDMCFNKHLGIANSIMIKKYAKFDRRAKQLMLLVKCWAMSKNINSAIDHTLSSYAYNNMVINYLQKVGVLPKFQAMDGVPNDYSNYVGYNITGVGWKFIVPINWKSANTLTISQLFYGFFSYYSTFDYQNYIISIKYGEPYPLHSAKLVYRNYNKRDRMCIEDPFDEQHNPAGHLRAFSFGVVMYEMALMEFKLRSISSPITDMPSMIKYLFGDLVIDNSSDDRASNLIDYITSIKLDDKIKRNHKNN